MHHSQPNTKYITFYRQPDGHAHYAIDENLNQVYKVLQDVGGDLSYIPVPDSCLPDGAKLFVEGLRNRWLRLTQYSETQTSET